MANRIFTNGEEGKILTSVGDRIIKQPYEFGNAFQNRMGLNNYILIGGLNLTQYYDALLWKFHNYVSSTYYNAFSLKNTNNDWYSVDTYRSVDNVTIYNVFNKNQNSAASNLSTSLVGSQTTSNQTDLRRVSVLASNINTNQRGNSKASSLSTQTNSFAIKEIYIGGSRPSNGTTPTYYSSASDRTNRFLLYSREISPEEFSFYYNNRLGNDPQSLNSLEIDLKCDFAEILDFSALQDGSDMRVGCRDYSGFNRHGEIMNLPAGTLQQKLDYANANLFVPFI